MTRKNAELKKPQDSLFMSEEVEFLVSGSYEQLAKKVYSAIKAEDKKLFGDALAEVKGTFAGYAIVRTESTNFFRVKFDKAENGTIVPIHAEPIAVKKYTADEFALREARAYVDAFLNTSKTEAAEHFQRLLPAALQATTRSRPAVSTPEKLDELAKTPRAWKKVYEDKLAQIRTACDGAEKALDEKRLRPKFSKLYDGAIEESSHEDYDGLVTSDLKYLQTRFSAIIDQMADAEKALDGEILALKANSKDATIQMFEAFRKDFVADVTSLEKALTEACETMNRVDARAKVYDVLSTHLHSYEVASLFVQKMSQRLAETEEG